MFSANDPMSLNDFLVRDWCPQQNGVRREGYKFLRHRILEFLCAAAGNELGHPTPAPSLHFRDQRQTTSCRMR